MTAHFSHRFAGLVLASSASLFGMAVAAPAPAVAQHAPEAGVSNGRSTLRESRPGAPSLGDWGVDLSTFDRSVDPGDDFFRFVNGAWLRDFVIPADYSNYGAFTALQELSEQRVRAIVEDAVSAGSNGDANQRMIANYYGSFLDTARIDALGLAPAQADLAAIESARTHADIAGLMGDPRLSLQSPVGPYVYPDAGQPDRYLLHVSQAGLGLPDRDYYLSEEYADKLAAYRSHIARMLALAETPDAQGAADRIVALETRMAEVQWSQTEMRDPQRMYNLRSGAQLVALLDGFDWGAFTASMGIDALPNQVIVNQPDALEALAGIFADTPVATWRDYLRYHYLSAHAAVLPSALDAENFSFYGRELNGQQEQQPRWKRAVNSVNEAMGETVGQLYVARHFPPESKAAMEELIANVRAALAERIAGLDWMGEETRAQALDKLEKFRAYVGYPDEWRDYSGLEVVAGDALGNMQRAAANEVRYQLARLGGPVRPGVEWGMTPMEVNAYYSPPRNAIYFPAAILQPPFFDPNADPAVNYGGIATVIGHEIGHGFDDEGSQYDGQGRLRNWWTEADRSRFEERTGVFGRQYAAYQPVPGMFINPDLTMGENVGDLGGVNVALHAYRLSLEGREAPVIDGYTGVQRFFLSYGQIWRRTYREDNLRMRMVADPHSPSEFRVNGIVRNIDDWYRAFDVDPADALYLPSEERVRIW